MLTAGAENAGMCSDLGIRGYPTVMAIEPTPSSVKAAGLNADKIMREVARSSLVG